jgi:hypothetical protein
VHRAFLGRDDHAPVRQEFHRPELRQVLGDGLDGHFRHLGRLRGARLFGEGRLLVRRVGGLGLDRLAGGRGLLAGGGRLAVHMVERRVVAGRLRIGRRHEGAGGDDGAGQKKGQALGHFGPHRTNSDGSQMEPAPPTGTADAFKTCARPFN